MVNPAGREISTPRWTKSGRPRPEFKFNFKYIRNLQILPNFGDSTIKHLFSFFHKKKFNWRRPFDLARICCSLLK